MIRPSNINEIENEADFQCDEHGGTVSQLNLMTHASRRENIVTVNGSELTPQCNCVSSFPTWSDKNVIGKDLGEARPNA